MRRVALLAVGVALVWGLAVRSAVALPPFFKEFQAKYLKPDSSDPKDQEFATLVAKTTKCNVCHVQGKPKKVHNAYGTQLSMILKKENFKPARLKAEPDKVKEEIDAALDAVAAKKSGDEKSPTFGELIAQGKLPGGDGKPAQVAATDKPAPAPAPAPTTPAPAPTTPAPPAEKAPLSAEAQAAIDGIQKIGGTVMQLAQNDDSLVVDFHLGGTSLGDDGLAAVKTLPKVVELDLKDTQITDAGLAHLAGIGTLVKLHLEKTKITDAGLAHLKDLGNLEYLNLYGTAVTDAGLEHLKGLKSLKKLFVWQTQVTDEGIAKFKEALPEVTVVK
jgi:Leucine Rich repeat